MHRRNCVNIPGLSTVEQSGIEQGELFHVSRIWDLSELWAWREEERAMEEQEEDEWVDEGVWSEDGEEVGAGRGKAKDLE